MAEVDFASIPTEEYAAIFAPLERVRWKTRLLIILLLGVTSLGAIALVHQWRHGLNVTGLGRPLFWGFYITNFVFFIGISHAGTLISAILRVSRVEWRRPIVRCAEAITVFAIIIGGPQVIVDLGRPDRLLNIFLTPRFESPLLWDVCSISIYFAGSVTYLYLPMIPDLALCRDRLLDVHPIKRWFYQVASLGWTGTKQQIKWLERGVTVLAISIIPIAISVHTVVSWIFSMTVQPMWHSTIFGPYFVAGAIYSGIAALLLAMYFIRRCYHLENYLEPIHFNNLGLLLLTMCCLWCYFTFAEHITTFYGGEPSHMAVYELKLHGIFAPAFWTMVVCCFVIPFPILAIPRLRTPFGTAFASVFVLIGMWLERYTIVTPTLSAPRLPYVVPEYVPTWVEWTELGASAAGLILLYVLFTTIFPVVSMWELEEGKAVAKHRAAEYAARMEQPVIQAEGVNCES